MTVYAGEIATALELIRDLGQSVTLRRRSAGTFDPIAQTVTGGTDQQQSVPGVALPPGNSKDFEPGYLIRRNVIEAWIPGGAVSWAPEPGDTLTANGHDWQVIRVYDLAPDGTSIVFKLYAER